MTGKPAKPDRYAVSRTGTPDPPNTEYYVLDLINDFDCRVALAYLGRSYERRGWDVRAREVFQVLEDTAPAHKAACEARVPKPKPGKKPRKEVIRP